MRVELNFKLDQPQSRIKKKSKTKIPVRVIEYTVETDGELKIYLLGRKTPLRYLKPRKVVQQVYGWLSGHYVQFFSSILVFKVIK